MKNDNTDGKPVHFVILFSIICLIELTVHSKIVAVRFSPMLYHSNMLECHLTPLNTIDLPTPFLIGSYHEAITCLANYDKAKKMLHQKFACETSFLTPLLIGSINDRMFILANRQVVVMGLTYRLSVRHRVQKTRISCV